MSGSYAAPSGPGGRADPAAQAYNSYTYGNGLSQLGGGVPRGISVFGGPGGAEPFDGAMTFDQFKRLYSALGAQKSSGQDQNTTPTAPPQPSDQLKGLMAQAADPYGTYGQLGVANPYMQNLTNRFGYDPSGLAYGVDLQKSPSWYLPGNVYPNVYQPKFTAAAMPYGIGQM